MKHVYILMYNTSEWIFLDSWSFINVLSIIIIIIINSFDTSVAVHVRCSPWKFLASLYPPPSSHLYLSLSLIPSTVSLLLHSRFMSHCCTSTLNFLYVKLSTQDTLVQYKYGENFTKQVTQHLFPRVVLKWEHNLTAL